MRAAGTIPTWAARGGLAAALLCGGLVLASPIDTPPPGGAGEWVPVQDRSLEIAAGSPLDFSGLAGDLGGDAPLAIAGDQLALNGAVPRINCATLAPGFSETAGSGFPDHQTADRYAVQLRRHGYNLARLHYVDALLMTGARQDFAFDPTQVDRFQYLLGALKRNGIRWSLDLMSSDNAAIGNVFPNRWSERLGMHIRVFVDPAAFAHWRTLALKLLTTRNPYTGLAPARDPSTAMLVLMNEGGITPQSVIAGKADKRFPALLQPAYAAWLQGRGGDPRAAATLPGFGEDGPAMEQFQRFLVDRQVAVTRDMTAAVRQAGYAGPVTGFDSWSQLNAIPLRRGLDLVDMHGYDQTPPGGRPGARVRPVSSLDGAGRYLQNIAGARFFGRPFTVTEHDQPFWNPYRYESGLAAPAMASLQGWQFICRHADGPIDLAYDGVGLRKQAVQPDGGGLDPVARAGETLTALLLLRREIAPARPSIGVAISDDQALAGGGWHELRPALTAAAWIARIGLVDARSRVTPDLTLPPDALKGGGGRGGGGSFAAAEPLVAALRQRGLLSARNSTDPANNRWESPGGQVLLIGDRRELQVRTPRTVAMAFERVDQPVALGPVQVTAADAPALLAFSALDDQPLARSGRILVILASDARNTGMQVAADGTLVSLGRLPVELRRVRVAATLAVPAGSRWRLTPLRLDGTPDAPLALAAGRGGLDARLDTAMSPRGPTTFFLLERE